jgi:hypothetical protein
MKYFANIDTTLSVALRANIISDNASYGSDCTLSDKSTLYSQISGRMDSEGYCGHLCFDLDTYNRVANSQNGNASTLTSSDLFSYFDCTQDIPVRFSQCISICDSSEATWYYSMPSGFTTIIPSGQQWSTKVKNSDKCIGAGIPSALKFLRSINLSQDVRTGFYCNNVVFSATNTSTNGSVKIASSATEFASKWDAAVKPCHTPKSCLVPNLSTILPHGEEVWVLVADTTAQSTLDKYISAAIPTTTICANGATQYSLFSGNATFFRLYCSDGTLALANNKSINNTPISYGKSDITTCGISSPSAQDHLNNLIDANSVAILSQTDLSISDIANRNFLIDLGKNSINSYRNLNTIAAN